VRANSPLRYVEEGSATIAVPPIVIMTNRNRLLILDLTDGVADYVEWHFWPWGPLGIGNNMARDSDGCEACWT
jgi:hypothetical protein